MPRPRIYPIGSTGTDRWRATEAKRISNGAVRKSFVFSAAVAECLAALREASHGLDDTKIVGDLIIAAGKKIAKAKKDA